MFDQTGNLCHLAFDPTGNLCHLAFDPTGNFCHLAVDPTGNLCHLAFVPVAVQETDRPLITQRSAKLQSQRGEPSGFPAVCSANHKSKPFGAQAYKS